MKSLMVVLFFCCACGMPQGRDGGVRNVSSLLARHGKGIAYHAQRVAEVTSLAGVNKNAKELRDRLTKMRNELEANIAQLDDEKDALDVNAEYQAWALGIKQELDYLAPDGELDLKVNLSKAKDSQAADLVLQNLQAVDNMLSAELPVLEHLESAKLPALEHLELDETPNAAAAKSIPAPFSYDGF